MKKIDIIIEKSLFYPVAQAVEINNKYSGSKLTIANTGESMRVSGDLDDTGLFSLGVTIGHLSYNWNKTIDLRIAQRSMETPWGKKYFEGTEAEKAMANSEDAEKRIAFPEGYWQNFISRAREHMDWSVSDGTKKTFSVDLNYPDTFKAVVDQYNDSFTTDFLVSDIYLKDGQLYFADIEYRNAAAPDVFLLGVLTSLKDEAVSESVRQANARHSGNA